MAEDLPLDNPTPTVDPIETPELDETAKALKHFGIDPDNLNSDDDDLRPSVDALVEIAKRGYRAEQKAMREKREKKEEPKSESGEFITKADLAMDRFIDKNPDLAEYREELVKYQKIGIPLEKAKLLIEADDTTIANREKASKAKLTGGESGGTRTYSDDDLISLSKKDRNAYNKAMDDIESGKARHKS